MKKRSVLVLLTVAAAAVTSSMQATYISGDLLVGFTSQGAANDFVFDVGPLSGLTSGETWTLGTDVAGTFTSAQFSSASWGVIGALSTTKTIYSSEGGAGVPSEDSGSFNTIRPNVAGVGNNSVASSGIGVGQTTANSWYTQTDQPNGTPGNFFFNNLDNPNVSTSATANLYSNDNLGNPAVLDGYFSISSDGNTLTFTAVPEPATWSLLAGFGLLTVYWRGRFGGRA